jgi:hypothetical protein
MNFFKKHIIYIIFYIYLFFSQKTEINSYKDMIKINLNAEFLINEYFLINFFSTIIYHYVYIHI